MIREIINFTNDLIAGIPDIMQWNVQPNKGLHIFVDIDENGEWKRAFHYGTDYYYYKEDVDDDSIITTILKYETLGTRVGTSMNKVLDKKSQIFSCSPFIVSFKKKSLVNEKLEGKWVEKIKKLMPSYFENARVMCLDDENLIRLSKFFENISQTVLDQIELYTIETFQEEGIKSKESIINIMKDDEYINIYLKNASLEEYQKAHDKYLTEKLFNKNEYNNEKKITNDTYGLSDFLNGTNSKKPFLNHKTALATDGISGRIKACDAKSLSNFEMLLNHKVFPNPLPIVVDKRELNKKCIEIYNTSGSKLTYREIIERLFSKEKIENMQDYYLLNYDKRKNIIINDLDFVPLFRYRFENSIQVENVTQAGKTKNKEKDPDIIIDNIFDFERIIVKDIFNNCLIKIKDGNYSSNYFGDVSSKFISGGDLMYQLILKYRKAFYDYIYKSQTSAISTDMFDDIMYDSILSNIRTEKIEKRCEWNNYIKNKINIWFSLYNLFNNNINTEIMASKVTDLLSKMRSVVKGDSIFEKPEEFAFGAGQVVSYLIDISVANDKTYALLEPYLQKTKSDLLQDAIAQTFAVYKHGVSTYKSAFHALASNVLTFDENISMKPLLKFFLAGCFSPCVIYDKKGIITINNKGE